MARSSIRIGVLGAGAIAQVVHLPMLSRMSGIEIAVLCDPDVQRARTLAKRMEVPEVVSEPDAVFEDESIDAVVVCTPSDSHEELVIGALAAGKHVLCEKPLSLTSAGAVRVVDAARSSPAALMVAMNQRFRPDAVALKSYMEGAEFGQICHTSTGWLARDAVPSLPSWRHDPARAGGGALMDIGIQMLDLALWMLNEPAPVSVSAVVHHPPALRVEESAHVFVRLEDGGSIAVEASWKTPCDHDRQYLDLRGPEGNASLSPMRGFKMLDGRVIDVTPSLPPRTENPYTASYRQELHYFIDIVRGRREGESPLAHPRLLAIVEAAYRSAEEGAEVRFEDPSADR